MDRFIYVSDLARDNNLELLAGKDGLNAKICDDQLSRPGLEFTGFFDYFDNKRLVLVGSKDHSFLKHLPLETQRKNIEKLKDIDNLILRFLSNLFLSND